MQARLKQTIEQLRRDLALSEERERQLTQKNKGLAAKLKTEKEEVNIDYCCIIFYESSFHSANNYL